ncbi:RidA family protein [Cytophagales bacterium LB-30]|uniref:RidA family protein n=1 Tax=Shiella aurantiaca TaxID=3058365 RepID=A0ABT8F6Y0_9BACT|nr:RidA family protein [Shiella aurantiaca]MDN4166187.1 RidA family protein [Shiella aurantiaca]
MTSLKIIDKLGQLGLQLPAASTPGGNYVSVNLRGDIAYVAIQFPILDGQYLFQGKLGTEISTEEGYKAMQLCALNVISQIHHKIGFEKIEGLNHIDAYYQPAEGWDESPKVVDGASDLFVNILGDKGKHSRAIIGTPCLVRNFSVGLVSTFTVI